MEGQVERRNETLAVPNQPARRIGNDATKWDMTLSLQAMRGGKWVSAEPVLTWQKRMQSALSLANLAHDGGTKQAV